MNQAVLEAKKQAVAEVSEKFKTCGSAVVVEYRGLSVAEVTDLRRQLRAEEVEFKVYKNSITTRAAEVAGYADLNEHLVGPNAVAFSSDAVAPSRILAKFAKKHDALVLKGGVVEGKVVGVDTIKELSSLPNKEGMLSMLLSCLQSPVRSFACVVKAVADAREEGTSSVASTEEAAAETAEASQEAA
ncbi:MAG: 50S ribosomal protein L10 [Erysipelotrichaceae bacterium]|nr:50S ribosomal protein L10 [Erysipelotrichaceae bacterium]